MIKSKLMKVLLTVLLSIIPLFSCWAGSLVKDEAVAYREEGFNAQSLGDLEGALMYYQKALTLDPHYAQAYNDSGVVYEAQGNDYKALEMYNKALEIDPNLLSVYTNLAFFYEKNKDIKNAAFYWQKRYELGQEGSYWWEVSRQHLIKLGTYPKLKKKRLAKEAIKLSEGIAQSNKQERLKSIEDAKFHFDIGNKAFLEKDYKNARKEFEAVFFINPSDEELLSKSVDLYKEAKRLSLREQITTDIKNALNYIESNDYLSAERRLKDVLESISRITQKK